VIVTESSVVVVDHPLLQETLCVIRSKDTKPPEFRRAVTQASMLIAMAATADLPTRPVSVETPLAVAKGREVAVDDFVLIPILRAGLGMVEGIMQLLPQARVGHLGLERNETTLEASEYYLKFPENMANSQVFVIDPMLATGGSAKFALAQVKARGARHIRLLGVIAAPEGIAAIHAEHPDVPIYVAAVDERLNEKGYIVPGLGDAGDRLFGTP
jgi:uracil phosphoribosyltransferase